MSSAAIPLAGLSAWQGLFDHGGLASGERVLVHGAAGGVGELRRPARALARGARDRNRLDRRRRDREELGAHQVVDNTTTRFEEAVEPVDLVFDTSGASCPALAGEPREGGRLVSIAEAPGGNGVYFVVEPSREQLAELAGLAERGELRALVDSVFR